MTRSTWAPMAVLLLASASCATAPGGAGDDATAGFPRSVETGRTGRPGTIQVSCVHRDGTPVRGASVRLYDVRDGVVTHRRDDVAATDGLGHAVLATDGPGTYRVALDQAPGVAYGWLQRGVHAHAVDVEVAPGDAAGPAVQIVVPRGGALEVRASRAGLAADDRLTVTLRHRHPSGDLLSRHDSNDEPKPFRDELRGTDTWLWEELPEGDYVVRVSVQEKRRARFFAVHVAPGPAGAIDVAPGPEGPPLEVAWGGELPAEGRVPVWLNPSDGGACLVRGDLAAGPHLSRGAAPGRYVAVLPNLGAAMNVELPEIAPGERWRMRLDPPGWVTPSPDGATVEVVVMRGNDRLSAAFVGIAPPATEHGRSGDWMRTRTGGINRFEGVPPGDWDVIVMDGVFADYAGLPRQTVRRVRVEGDDLSVTVRVPAE